MTLSLPNYYLVIYFFRKMILLKTRYKTYNSELLIIIETSKNWRYNLNMGKYEALIFIGHGKLNQYMNTIILSSCKVC